MRVFCINPLSASEQCQTIEQALKAVSNLVACFKFLLAPLEQRRVRLIYDILIEQRALIMGRNFMSVINSLPVDEADTKKLWFVYTKNRAEEAATDVVNVNVTVAGNSESVTAEISRDVIEASVQWLSLGGKFWTESPALTVATTGVGELTIKNAYHVESLKLLMPRYESSTKHGKHAYFDKSGDYVSPMPLDDLEAEALLLLSVEDGNDRWAYHEGSRKYYRFKATRIEEEIFHGFEVESVPQEIFEQFHI